MANLTGTSQAFHNDTASVDTSQVAILGTRAWDTEGNEFVYLQGTASTVAGDWVRYTKDNQTERLVANAVGPVGVAMAAITADRFGWYQIKGINELARTDTIVANKSLYIDGTTGRADDLGVTGDLIVGALSLTADTANVATVSLNYPYVTDDLGTLGTTTPGGGEGTIQYNASSAFTGSAGFVFNQVVGSARLSGIMEVEDISIEDSDASDYLRITTTSNLTAERTLTLVPGDASRTVTISGNTTISQDYSTAGNPQFATIELGAASDTTISRVSAGVVAVEGVNIVDVSSTQTLTNKVIGTPSTIRVTDANFTMSDNLDDSKRLEFQLSGITAGNIRTLTIPDVSTTIVGTDATQTLTNKTIGVASMGTGTTSLTAAYAVVCAGTTTTAPLQSIADVGSSGQVLTSNGASALPTFQAAAGGGTTFQLSWIPIRDAVLPNVNFPALVKNSATNVVYESLDFDDITSYKCYFTVPVTATPVNSAKLMVLWTASSGSGTFTVDADWRSVSDGEAIDSTAIPTITNDTATDTLLATGTVHSFDVPLLGGTSKMVAGDLLHINFSRDVADTLSGSAKVVAIALITS